MRRLRCRYKAKKLIEVVCMYVNLMTKIRETNLMHKTIE